MSEHDVEKLDAMMDHRPMCQGCGQKIDPEVCWCGEMVRDHHMNCNHGPVPMGCYCFRQAKEEGR